MAYGLFELPNSFNAPNFIFDRIVNNNASWESLVKTPDSGNNPPDDGVFQNRYCLFLSKGHEEDGSILVKKSDGWYLKIGSTKIKDYSLRVNNDGVLYLAVSDNGIGDER